MSLRPCATNDRLAGMAAKLTIGVSSIALRHHWQDGLHSRQTCAIKRLALPGANSSYSSTGKGPPCSFANNLLARLKHDVLDKKPDWMTLFCGANDVNFNVDLPTYRKNMTSIVDQAQAQGIKVLILTPTGLWEDLKNRPNQNLAGYVEFLHQLAQEKKCLLADLNANFRTALTSTPPTPGTYLLTIDGVHPNPAGDRLIAREVLKTWGVPDADMPKVENAWSAIPEGATLASTLAQVSVKMTLGQYETLDVKFQ